MDRQRELKKYRNLMAVSGIAALVATFGSLFFFSFILTPFVAYFGSSLVALPFIVVIWRLDSRYTDLLFRDDLE